MKLIEEKGNLFDLPLNYDLAHCISLDCAMGAGIAKTFAKQFPELKPTLLKCIDMNNLDYPITISVPVEFDGYDENRIIHNLITKEKYWNKPTYKTIEECVNQLAFQCKQYDTKYLGMPLIGCGLDRLEWNKVKAIIEKEFDGIDIEIVVRYL